MSYALNDGVIIDSNFYCLSVCRVGVEECNFQEAPFISTEHNKWNFPWDRYYNICILVKVMDGPLPAPWYVPGII